MARFVGLCHFSHCRLQSRPASATRLLGLSPHSKCGFMPYCIVTVSVMLITVSFMNNQDEGMLDDFCCLAFDLPEEVCGIPRLCVCVRACMVPVCDWYSMYGVRRSKQALFRMAPQSRDCVNLQRTGLLKQGVFHILFLSSFLHFHYIFLKPPEHLFPHVSFKPSLSLYCPFPLFLYPCSSSPFPPSSPSPSLPPSIPHSDSECCPLLMDLKETWPSYIHFWL